MPPTKEMQDQTLVDILGEYEGLEELPSCQNAYDFHYSRKKPEEVATSSRCDQ